MLGNEKLVSLESLKENQTTEPRTTQLSYELEDHMIGWLYENKLINVQAYIILAMLTAFGRIDVRLSGESVHNFMANWNIDRSDWDKTIAALCKKKVLLNRAQCGPVQLELIENTEDNA